jgi:hypothetical protein
VALRRETGFEEDDAPSAEDPNTVKDDRDQDTGDGDSGPGSPELPVDETTREPDTLPASAAPLGDGLLAAADGLIWGALTSAGEKLLRTPACPRSERGRAKTVQAAALHTLLTVDTSHVEQWRLLDGAWSRVPEIAARYGLNPDCLTDVLDSYCRELIAAGVEHRFEQTSGVLHAPCLAAA